MPKSKTDRAPFYYPDYITEVLFRLGEASSDDKYPLLNKRIDIIYLLFDQFESYPITEQVYDYVWWLLNQMASNGYDNWVEKYWSYACQYYQLSLQYNSEDLGKNRFREFHLMVGALMVYLKKYDLLRFLMTFTSSLPAQFPLVPSTFHYIVESYKELAKKNESMYLLKYHFIGMNEGAREDSKIEGLLLDYIALLLIRLNTVNDYNITFSDPLDPPLEGDTVEETTRNINLAETIRKRVKKWRREEETMKIMGFLGGDIDKAISLLNEYSTSCLMKHLTLSSNRDISEVKRNALRSDMIKSASILHSFVPMGVGREDGRMETSPLIASQSIELDEKLILSGRDPISNNLGESLIGALYTEMRLKYCYLFLSHSTAVNYAIPYRDIPKAFERLELDDNYTILAMGVSPHFFDEVDGFSRNLDSEVSYNGIKVIEIASSESSFIIMKSNDVPFVSLRCLTEDENIDHLEEIEETHHLYSNINGLRPDNLILKTTMGFNLHIFEPMRYVRIRIAYQLDSDNVVLNRVMPIKDYIV